MTHKFWDNWKKRASETKTISLTNSVYTNKLWTRLFFDSRFDKFEDFQFDGDTVVIKYFDTIDHNHYKVTLERKNIKTVTF